MKKNAVVIIIVVLLAFVVNSAVFTVDETEQALVLQFSRIVRSVTEPGLAVKIPFIQDVIKYEKRLLRYDAAPAEFLTRDKKSLVVDTYTRFKISDPTVFYGALRDLSRAHARLDNIISSALREAVASHDQSDIITEKREPIMKEVTTESREKAAELGVEIIDVRIKRTDFPPEIAESIHARMRAERERISKRFRSEGAEEQLKIKAETDKEKTIILAEAKRQSEFLRGEGDALAIKIYAQALEQDPEFYAFVRSLELYREALGRDSTLILSAGSPLFKYLEGAGTGTP